MMFSSSITNNSTATSPFQPYFPFSSSNYHHHHHPPPPPPPPPPCVNHETGDIFLHPHLHDPLSGQFSLHNNICSIAPPAQTMSTTHLGIISSNSFSPNISADHHHHHQYYHNHSYGNFNSGDNIPYFFHSKEEDVVVPATKKDRHSKIFTAQGLRDRRVRLSINVARQFFDLQDLLGFDKASKTLDWLLTKSRKAIKQLGPKTQHLTCSSELFKSLSSASECDDVVPDINEVDQVMSKDEEMTMTMMRKLKESESGVHALVARVSRAKARARARERTREKSMCNSSKRAQILNHHQPNCETSRSSTSKGNIGNHHVNQELGSLLGHQVPHHHHHHDQEDDQPVQSVIKTNLLKQSSSVYDSIYNQEKYLNVISAESSAHHQSSSNHSIQFPINASQNWDINGAFPGPSINCSITNINLSTGI